MTSRFRTGQLYVCRYFLEAIPRPAMLQAIIRHVTDDRHLIEGETTRTEYQHGGIWFHLETTADRESTTIRLNTATIRLACLNCDRDDKDGITEAELRECKASGWTTSSRSRATRNPAEPSKLAILAALF